MPKIIFSALSFLRAPLREKGVDCCESAMEVAEGMTAEGLIEHLGIAPKEVEAVLINGRAADFATTLGDGDRVALLPPGTPGPHRVLLRIRKPG